MNKQEVREWLPLLPSRTELQDLGRGVSLGDSKWLCREASESASGQLTTVGVRKLESAGAELRRLVVDEWKARHLADACSASGCTDGAQRSMCVVPFTFSSDDTVLPLWFPLWFPLPIVRSCSLPFSILPGARTQDPLSLHARLLSSGRCSPLALFCGACTLRSAVRRTLLYL